MGRRLAMALGKPFNLMTWIENNRELLKPPVLNRTLWQNTDFIVQIVGGPNERTDFHDDPYEEFFYQLKGNIILRVMEEGRRRNIPISKGEVFLLPPHV